MTAFIAFVISFGLSGFITFRYGSVENAPNPLTCDKITLVHPCCGKLARLELSFLQARSVLNILCSFVFSVFSLLV